MDTHIHNVVGQVNNIPSLITPAIRPYTMTMASTPNNDFEKLNQKASDDSLSDQPSLMEDAEGTPFTPKLTEDPRASVAQHAVKSRFGGAMNGVASNAKLEVDPEASSKFVIFLPPYFLHSMRLLTSPKDRNVHTPSRRVVPSDA